MPRAPSRTTSFMANPGELPADDDPLLAFVPVAHKQMKRNSINPERQRKFIAPLAASGVVSRAAREIRATPEAMYHLRNRAGAEQFCAAWDTAIDRAMTRLEGSALTRAIEGEQRMVVSGGQLLGFETRWNDRLVMFFLRSRQPERYGVVRAEDLKPGHPQYERIRQELRRNELDIEEVRAEILRKVAAIERARAREPGRSLTGDELSAAFDAAEQDQEDVKSAEARRLPPPSR